VPQRPANLHRRLIAVEREIAPAQRERLPDPQPGRREQSQQQRVPCRHHPEQRRELLGRELAFALTLLEPTPTLRVLIAQPADELGDVPRRDLLQPQPTQERDRITLQIAPVLVARVLREPAAAVALVAAAPVARILGELLPVLRLQRPIVDRCHPAGAEPARIIQGPR
jgi:hypothetical protein